MGVRRSTFAALAAALALAACSSGGAARRPEPAPQPLRLWVAPIVWWEQGAALDLDVAIENATLRTVALAAPDAANARVALFAGPEPEPLCALEPREPPATPRARIELAPADRVAVRVSLAGACGALAPGEYRYEVSYRSPAPADGPAAAGEPGPAPARAFSGPLDAAHGQIVVTPAPPADGSAGAGARGR